MGGSSSTPAMSSFRPVLVGLRSSKPLGKALLRCFSSSFQALFKRVFDAARAFQSGRGLEKSSFSRGRECLARESRSSQRASEPWAILGATRHMANTWRGMSSLDVFMSEAPVSSSGSPLHSISGSFQTTPHVEYVPVAPNSGSYEKEKARSHVIDVLWLFRCPFGASARSVSS